MQFLTPLYFFLSIFLIAVIAFYLFRKQFERQIIPSTYLWQEVMREWQATKWWKKLQQHLLLYLQLLALLMLMFALVRPFIGNTELTGEHIVIVIDTSASMTALEGESNRLDIAKDRIVELVDKIENQKLTLIEANSKPTIVFANDTSKANMRNTIQNLESSFQTADVNGAIQLANQLLANSSGEIHLFSDNVSKEMIEDRYLTHSVVVHNHGTSLNNVSLRAFGVAPNGEKVTGMVSVYNEAKEQQTVTITIEHEGEILTSIEQTVDSKQLKTIHIEELPHHISYKAVITNKDDYEVDNTRYAFLTDDAQSTLYIVGDVSPFVTRVLSHLSSSVIQIDKNSEIPNEEQAIYVISGVPYEKWPNGPTLMLSPTNGAPFNIKEKQELKTRLEVSKDDPLMKFVEMEEVYIQDSYPFEATELDTIVKSGDISLISKGTYHGNRVVFLGFDIEDTDWPLHSSFPIFLYNSLSFLTEQQQLLGYFQPSEIKEIAFSTTAKNVYVLDEDDEEVLTLNLNENVFKAPNIPGLYKIVEESTNGAQERMFAVTIDEEESSITPSKSFTFEVDDHDTEGISKKIPNEIWVWFVIIAFIVLLIEWEVYRRGTTA